MDNKASGGAGPGIVLGRQPSLISLQNRIRDTLLRNPSTSNISNIGPDVGNDKKAKAKSYVFFTSRVLGKGSFGEVLKSNDPKGNVFAMKVELETERAKRRIDWEVKILKVLKKLNCRKYNCIELIKSYRLGNKRYLQFPMLGPSLYDRIRLNNEGCARPGNGFFLDQIQDILGQLFSAVDFLHRHHIAHFDIKTDNILFVDGQYFNTLEADTNIFRVKMKNTTVRLIDFGLAMDYPEKKKITRNLCAKVYRPPEVVFKTEYGISYPVDIWCLGLVGAAMYLGRNLFRAEAAITTGQLLLQMEIVLGHFPPEILESEIAKQYFCNGRTKPLSGHDHYVVELSVPFRRLKKTSSPKTDRLFNLLEKMLSLDSRMRPTSWELLPNPD